MLVSTVHNPSERELHLAEVWAQRMGCRVMPRNGQSLKKMQAMTKQGQVIIITRQDVRCYIGEQPPIFFHPSTAHLRVKRMIEGERDPLISVSGATAGDRIVDCTAGLGADAIVFSHQVGVGGQVMAVERTALLYWLMKDGMQHYESEVPEMNAAMRRIEPVLKDHLNYLHQLKNKSVDIVYFDPMFRLPLLESSALLPMRQIAYAEPLMPEAITEAKRVARKAVVMKEHRTSPEFTRLNFEQVHRTYSNLAYGVIYL